MGNIKGLEMYCLSSHSLFSTLAHAFYIFFCFYFFADRLSITLVKQKRIYTIQPPFTLSRVKEDYIAPITNFSPALKISIRMLMFTLARILDFATREECIA